MQPARADRHAQADFARALGHRHQQNVHDADAADHQRDRGDGGEQQRHDAARALGGLGDLTEIAHGEIGFVARADAVAALENGGDLPDYRRDLLLADRLHEDLVYIAGEMRLQRVRIGRAGIDPVELRLRLRRRGDAQHFTFRSGERDHHQIVLVRAERRLALGFEHADHPQRCALHLDERADRDLRCAEQLGRDRLADDGDLRGSRLVVGRNSAPSDDPPICHRRIVDADALDLRAPVLIAVLHLSALADQVADLARRCALAQDRLRVGGGERGRAAESAAHAAHHVRARQHHH